MDSHQDKRTLGEHDAQLLQWMRQRRRQRRAEIAQGLRPGQPPGPDLGQRVADRVAATVGSWRFIIVQSLLITLWLGYNLAHPDKAWDPYPFILLNLLLSFQAAYTAPAIMMSQNRQAEIDRHQAGNDYEVNIKAELEIEWLHQKIDLMREKEIKALTDLVRDLTERIAQLTPR